MAECTCSCVLFVDAVLSSRQTCILSLQWFSNGATMKLLVGNSKKVSTLMGAGVCQSAVAVSALMIELSGDYFACAMSFFRRSFRSFHLVFGVK